MRAAATSIAAGAFAAGLAAGGLFYASRWPTSQIFGATLIAGTDRRDIALTFDDGPNDAATPLLLETLARHDVKATFFVMGAYARQRPQLVRDVAAAGHLLANHTMTHPNLSLQTATRVRQELTDCNAVLEDIIGAAVRLFRPPFGGRRPEVLRIARELGLTPVMWNVTGFDWKPIGVEGLLKNLKKGVERNQRMGRASNLLLHDGGHRAMGASRLDTVLAVERLLGARPGTGTRFVTVDAWTGAEQQVVTSGG